VPTLSLKRTPPLAQPARLQALASTLTELTSGKAQALTAVLIEPLTAERWL
jgi:hypothetical protein